MLEKTRKSPKSRCERKCRRKVTSDNCSRKASAGETLDLFHENGWTRFETLDKAEGGS